MTDRYSVVDVRHIFATFREVADRHGFDTRLWALEEGGSYGRHYRLITLQPATNRQGTTEFRDDLGGSAREAYTILSTRIDVFTAIDALRSAGNSHQR